VAIDLLEFEVRAEDEWPEFSVNISLTSVLEERKNRCFVTNSEVLTREKRIRLSLARLHWMSK
jgi:hypothetical protein